MQDEIPTTTEQVPGATHFHCAAGSFSLDVLTTIYELQDLAEEVRQRNGSHRQYLDDVITHLHDRTGVQLSYGEADWLNDNLAVHLAEAKKKRFASLVAARGLPNSTASTPDD